MPPLTNWTGPASTPRMFPSGRFIETIGEMTLNCSRSVTDSPSISSDKFEYDEMCASTHSRNSASLDPNHGSLSTVEHSALMIGNRSAVPDGTSMCRVAVPVALKTPPRNQTFPFCPAAALTPVSSNNGWPSAGNENAHSHQAADHSS